MALPSSGEISFGALADNKNSASRSDIDIKTYSELFSVGAYVGDLDSSGTPNESADRDLLDAAPYSMDEFYGADYPNELFDTVVAKLSDGTTDVTSNGYVDGEAGRIYFEVNEDPSGTQTYTAGLKYASDHSIAVSNTSTDQSIGLRYISITAPSTSEANDKYYPFVSTGTYTNATAENINHYDQLASGTTSLSYSSTNVDASDESVSNLTITPSVSTGTQTGYSISPSSITAGDGGTMTATDTGEGNIFSITNTPGVIRFTTTHNGSPTSARNNTSSTGDLTISYNVAINGASSTVPTSDDYTVNSGTSFTITAISEGVQSKTMRMGYGTSNSNTTYTGNSDKSISDTRYVRSTQTNAFTVTLGNSTSLSTYYPKAHYTTGTQALTAGSAISIAPPFIYTTTNDQTIDVNNTQVFSRTLTSGNGASVSITSSPNIGIGTNSATMTPNENNGVYTITYTGIANYSQPNNQSDTLTVRPTVSITGGTSGYPTVDGNGIAISSTTHGVSITTFTITPSVEGSNITTYAWSMDSGWSYNGGYSSSTQGAILGKFTTPGSKSNNTLTVSGNSTSRTSTAHSITITSVTKNWDSATSTETDLRRSATWTVAAVVDYIMRPKLQRYNGSSWIDISNTPTISGGGDNQSVSIDFTISSGMVIDATYREVRVVDSDNTSKTDSIGNYAAKDGAAGTPTGVTDSLGNGSAGVSWSDGAYNDSGNKVYIYTNSGGTSLVATSGATLITPSNSYTYNYDSTSTVTRYFRVTGYNNSNEVSNPSSVSDGAIIYPVLSVSRNVINPGTSPIYSTTNNTDTGTYPTSITYSTPTSATDNVTSRTYSTTALTGHTFGNGSATSHAATTTTYGGGTGVGDRTITLAIAGNSSQTSNTTHALVVNYMPRILSITYTSGTIQQNVTDVKVYVVYWQGYASSGFTAKVVNSSGTQISQNSVTISGTNFTDHVGSSGAGGGQIGDSEWWPKHGSPCNLGTVSESGTKTLRITSTGAASTFDQSISIAGWTAVSITSKSSGGWNNQEDPLMDGGGAGSPVSKYYLGSLGNGTTLYNTQSNSSPFNGGGYYHHDDTNSYVLEISSGGVISNYTSDANAQPKAPTGVGSSSTTSAITITWTDFSDIEDNYYAFYNSGSSNDADYNDTAFSGNAYAAGTETATQSSGISTSQTYSMVVYAKNGSSYSNPLRTIVTTISPRALNTNDSSSTLDLWVNETNTYKYSDAFILTLSDTILNDQLVLTITHSGDTLSDITTKMAANKTNGTSPYNTGTNNTQGASVQETTYVSTPRTLTFSSLSSGTNYFTVMVEGLSDGTVNAFGPETATFTVTATVKDSGGSTVVASATYHTYQQKMNPLA